MKALLKVFGLSLLFLGPVQFSDADIAVPGADGSDGVFDPPASIQIDLGRAVPLPWDQPQPAPTIGRGVYDFEQWAVVFKYSSVRIRPNVVVTFKNHPSNAPVVWLVSGTVVIEGTINLNGSNGHGDNVVATVATPGPGGFRGGRGSRSAAARESGGYGPGGASRPVGGDRTEGSGAGYASAGGYGGTNGGVPGAAYGNTAAMPLIGGSGGAGARSPGERTDSGGGGAGGGSILLACKTSIQISGVINANGGQGNGYYKGGHGSGGAIRLIADTIAGNGALKARGVAQIGGAGASSSGRIRVEANIETLVDRGDPFFVPAAPGPVALLWPSDLEDVPSVRIVSVDGQPVPTDPRASLNFPGTDVTVGMSGSQQVEVEGTNVPLDWVVRVRYLPQQFDDSWVTAGFISGDANQSTWHANVNIRSGFSVMQVRASKPGAVAAEWEEEGALEQESTEP